MLVDIFENKQCFKLICGAGNEDCTEVEKLVALYALAGCRFFDVCAKTDVVRAAKNGLKRAKMENSAYICISVGSESDIHFCKAEIDSDLCSKCQKCSKICPQDAIDFVNNTYQVNQIRCIGCSKCVKKCPNNAIKLISKGKTDYNDILPPLINEGLDCIEFHIIGNEGKDIKTNWKKINNLFDGMLSISINRSSLGDKKLVKLISKLIKKRKPYTTIIQADGIPMSGGKDSFGSTLQAVAIADMFKNANLPVYIIASGGTNSKTAELAKMCDVRLDGVAIGSYARKIVKEYIDRDDFFENQEIFNKALVIAKTLVKKSLDCLLI